jgi:membrane-bound serine protease (ClpP class)
LVALACSEIYMAPGGVFGAATPVDGAGNTASEKTISAVRSTFRATAEFRNRDPSIAEAMVDPALRIEGLVDSGQLLTLSTEQALAFGYSDGVATSIDDVLNLSGLPGSDVETRSPGLAERFVRFVTDPVIASLLITAGILLLIGDLLVAGFGPVGVIGLILLGLFFWGHNIAGLAGWEDLLLIVVGLGLLGIEAFVIPGFGLFGLAGLASLAAGFWMAMINGDFRVSESTTQAGWAVAASMVLIFIGIIVIISLVPKVSLVGGLVLDGTGSGTTTPPARPPVWLRLFGGGEKLLLPSESAAGPATSVPRTSLAGRTGTAISDLRPSGIAIIDGIHTDVVTDGEYVESGESVVVVADEKYRRVVRRSDEPARSL